MLVTPKGMRRHNLLNLMRTSPRQGWAGAVPNDQIDGDREEAFINDFWGLRAACIVLLNYQRRNGWWSIDQMFEHFAPPSENDTEAYKRNMASAIGVATTTPVDLRDRDRFLILLKAAVRQEEGEQPCTDEQLLQAIDAALKSVSPPINPGKPT